MITCDSMAVLFTIWFRSTVWKPMVYTTIFFLTFPVLSLFAQETDRPEAKDSSNSADYQRDILPLFQQHCLECHNAQESASSLQIDSRSSLLAGGDYGKPAIIPGQPDKSFLLQILRREHEDLRMPPEGDGLSDEEVALLARWVQQGATFNGSSATDSKQAHWSLQPIPPWDHLENKSSTDKQVAGKLSAERSTIDSLLLQRLNEQGLAFSEPAKKKVLIRRLYLVMLGLQPSRQEIESFVADSSPNAWEKLVDQVLANPQYGPRWARHWLDAARFGETDGYETNRERPNAWRYRDWVVDSLNQDLPYDEFVQRQIAGDVLGDPVATGFLVGGPVDIVKSPDPRLTRTQRQDELTDFVNTTGTVFLGLTLGCARCHNHKFDPVTQKDFYAMQAVFSGVHHGEAALPLDQNQQQAKQDLEEQIAEIDLKLNPYKTPPAFSEVPIRWPVLSTQTNIDSFAPQKLIGFRFRIQATNNGSEPCIDELQFALGDQPVTLLPTELEIKSAGDYQGNPKHKLEHVVDGKVGNDFSWISDQPGQGMLELTWQTALEMDRVTWGRDRRGEFADRMPTQYSLEGRLPDGTWIPLADSTRRPMEAPTNTGEVFYFPENMDDSTRALVETRNQLQTQSSEINQQAKAYCGTFTSPEPVHRMFRGDAMNPQEEVSAETLQVLGSLNLPANASDQQRRLALAQWLTSDANPLTARVIVNRLWQHHFGTGIVETPSDFGLNGAPPSHPELLNYLASELRQNGWSLKSIHRQILLSQAWQQSSTPNSLGLTKDGATRLLWRFPPRRLEAESIRDCILQTTGDLDPRLGGPGFSAFEVELENVRHYFPKTEFGPDDWRRMIYQTKIRQEQDSVFGSFDCPDASQIAPKRSRSTTPLQALNLFNSQFILQQSQRFAEHLTELAPEVESQVEVAYWRTFGREPSRSEVFAAVQFVRAEGLSAFCRAMFNSNEFLFLP